MRDGDSIADRSRHGVHPERILSGLVVCRGSNVGAVRSVAPPIAQSDILIVTDRAIDKT